MTDAARAREIAAELTPSAGNLIPVASGQRAAEIAALLTALADDAERYADETQVDEEYLWSIGFVDEDEGEWTGAMVLPFNAPTGQAVAFIEYETAIWFGVKSLTHSHDCHSRLAALTTRGQLLKLLSALQITIESEK